jgi:hypothetical protein
MSFTTVVPCPTEPGYLILIDHPHYGERYYSGSLHMGLMNATFGRQQWMDNLPYYPAVRGLKPISTPENVNVLADVVAIMVYATWVFAVNAAEKIERGLVISDEVRALANEA